MSATKNCQEPTRRISRRNLDFKLDTLDRARDAVQIRAMRNVHFDRELHELKVGENFEVTLEK